MWENAGALIGVPAALKAALDVYDRIRKGQTTPANGASEGSDQLKHIHSYLNSFAIDALELKAYKDLHSVTNRFPIDLHETFAIISPIEDHTKARFNDSSALIKAEFMNIRKRAWADLINLRSDKISMTYLSEMPDDITCCVKNGTWDAYYMSLVTRANEELENFRHFRRAIEELIELNAALNNYANQRIVQGIDQFNKLMADLRGQLRGVPL